MEFWSLQETRNKGSSTYSNFGDNVAHDERGKFRDIANNFSHISS